MAIGTTGKVIVGMTHEDRRGDCKGTKKASLVNGNRDNDVDRQVGTAVSSLHPTRLLTTRPWNAQDNFYQ